MFKNTELGVTADDDHTTSEDPEDSVSNGVVLQLDVGDTALVQISGIFWDEQ